jgi:hypothetical protein
MTGYFMRRFKHHVDVLNTLGSVSTETWLFVASFPIITLIFGLFDVWNRPPIKRTEERLERERQSMWNNVKMIIVSFVVEILLYRITDQINSALHEFEVLSPYGLFTRLEFLVLCFPIHWLMWNCVLNVALYHLDRKFYRSCITLIDGETRLEASPMVGTLESVQYDTATIVFYDGEDRKRVTLPIDEVMKLRKFPGSAYAIQEEPSLTETPIAGNPMISRPFLPAGVAEMLVGEMRNGLCFRVSYEGEDYLCMTYHQFSHATEQGGFAMRFRTAGKEIMTTTTSFKDWEMYVMSQKYDFVILTTKRDKWSRVQLKRFKLVKPSSNGVARVYTADRGRFYVSSGTASKHPEDSFCMRRHTASTRPGASGSPVVANNGVQGIHLGCSDGRTYNRYVDLVSVLSVANAVRVKKPKPTTETPFTGSRDAFYFDAENEFEVPEINLEQEEHVVPDQIADIRVGGVSEDDWYVNVSGWRVTSHGRFKGSWADGDWDVDFSDEEEEKHPDMQGLHQMDCDYDESPVTAASARQQAEASELNEMKKFMEQILALTKETKESIRETKASIAQVAQKSARNVTEMKTQFANKWKELADIRKLDSKVSNESPLEAKTAIDTKVVSSSQPASSLSSHLSSRKSGARGTSAADEKVGRTHPVVVDTKVVVKEEKTKTKKRLVKKPVTKCSEMEEEERKIRHTKMCEADRTVKFCKLCGESLNR